MSVPAIEITGLSKSFGHVQALRNLDLAVELGEVHALLGPNGAGKSTAIRILLGLLRANSGTAVVLGQDPWQDLVSLHQRIAYVPGDVSLWPSLTGGEALDLICTLRGQVDPSRRRELVELFDFDPSRRCATYSKGNRQKVAIIAALAARADLFIFDEPTSGLDPLMELTFQSEVRRLADAGATVLLSSHILSEAESLADRISIIREGQIVRTGTLAQLQQGARHNLRAVFRGAPPTLPDLGADAVEFGADWLVAKVPGELTAAVLRAVSASDLVDFSFAPPTLEELFRGFYEDPSD